MECPATSGNRPQDSNGSGEMGRDTGEGAVATGTGGRRLGGGSEGLEAVEPMETRGAHGVEDDDGSRRPLWRVWKETS